MADMETPNRSPATLEMVRAASFSRDADTAFVASAFVIFPLVGGVIGFAGYLAAAMMIEVRNPPTGPMLSYGQQAGLISLPVCTIIAAAIGVGAAFAAVRRYVVSIVLLLSVSLCGWGVINFLWNDQIARYGRDPSEIVLYYPPLTLSALALVTAVTIAVIGVVRRQTQIT